MDAYLFYILATISVAAAVYLIFEKNPVFSALYLIQIMVCIAVLYILLEAQFIAAVQMIVYAGAIMVLFLFVIMLLHLNVQEDVKDVLPFQKIPAIFDSGLCQATPGRVRKFIRGHLRNWTFRASQIA